MSIPMQIKKSFVSLLMLAGTLTACCPNQQLTVFTSYVTHENRASYFVGTPDPCLTSPPLGQRLYVSWRLQNQNIDRFPLELKLYLRLRNLQQRIETIQINSPTGGYVYQLLCQDYFDSGGILAYKLELYADDQIIDQLRHLMWVDLIEIGDDEDEDNSEES